MRTASYFDSSGPGRIGISRGRPRGISGYRVFRPLAPGAWFRSVSTAVYVARYRAEVLALLDPAETWDQLHRLADGAEPVLLCFERVPFHAENWCHRRLVAEWLERALDVEVPEVAGPVPSLHETVGFDPWAGTALHDPILEPGGD